MKWPIKNVRIAIADSHANPDLPMKPVRMGAEVLPDYETQAHRLRQ